ncbi:MAG: hypothetical protein OJF47_002600 [Nitrospira sp.]|jgi:uncharacterized membrane-anchored protein|nr:MAG: hypothetical protein OJF47_002600 [Nitrospira sp.]
MTDSAASTGKETRPAGFLNRIHQSNKQYLPQWLGVPAHIHHVAYRLANPPVERPNSRREFQQLLQALDISEGAIEERFGYGFKTAHNGDRLVVVWEAHTEYYSYQVWHVVHDAASPLDFGPITFPDFVMPLSPLGLRVNALDMLFLPQVPPSEEELPARLPGAMVYGSRIVGDEIVAVTSFTPDEFDRERYLVCSASEQALRQQVAKIVDTVVAIENYYHLVMLPMKAFSRAVDQIHDYEQRHLHQRAVLIEQLSGTTPQIMQKWLTVLTQDLLQVSRLAESMRYRLSASVPYDRIVQSNMASLQERPYGSLRRLSEYVIWKITGVTEGYQQLLRRIDAMEKDFEATVAVLRTHIELRLQEQNIGLQDQNMKLLASVDSTTRAQAILQRTVESLSVIVITYYLTGLGSYVLKACYEMGWLKNATLATAIFVPIAFGISFTLMTVGRKIIVKRMMNSTKDDAGD